MPAEIISWTDQNPRFQKTKKQDLLIHTCWRELWHSIVLCESNWQFALTLPFLEIGNKEAQHTLLNTNAFLGWNSLGSSQRSLLSTWGYCEVATSFRNFPACILKVLKELDLSLTRSFTVSRVIVSKDQLEEPIKLVDEHWECRLKSRRTLSKMSAMSHTCYWFVKRSNNAISPVQCRPKGCTKERERDRYSFGEKTTQDLLKNISIQMG